MKNLLFKLYMLGFICLVLFFIFLIWKLTFAHFFEEYHARKRTKEIAEFKEKAKEEGLQFEKIILESEKKVKLYLGYRVLEELRIKGHFHHTGFEIEADRRSYCIECHGDMPHSTAKETRAFLNMHAFFIACETCHMKLEKAERTGVFKWYDKRTGEIVESPVQKFKPGTYNAKIIPFERVNGELKRMDSQERIEFTHKYKERKKELTEFQKRRALKLIHKKVTKQPVLCEDCHQKKEPYLPFEALGYPKERINSIIGTEVVGMVKEYAKFYIPRMLQPGVPKKK
jgi:hypothetical protein